MSPKEKAGELIEKYVDVQKELDETTQFYWEFAKSCALITVDEILSMKIVRKDDLTDEYWERVKQEIELL